MRHTPRNLRLAVALLLACGACAPAALAQARAAAPTPQGKTAARVARGMDARDAKERDARAERSRRGAVAVLLEVLGGAKAIEETFDRASVLTLSADALWDADEQAARSAFGRAWEAAAESDESEFKVEQEHGRYGDLPERFTRARELVLAAAARRDASMAEAWLGALAEWLSRQESGARDPEAPGHEASRDAGPLDEFTRDGQRLALASSLLDEEDYEAAARVAAPSLKGGVSGAFVEFLLDLREGAPEEADRLYLQLLASVRAGANSDANDLLLLSSYALTPRLLVVVNDDGSLRFRTLGDPPDAAGMVTATAVSSRARAAFFEAAAAVLRRPAQPGGAAAGDAAALYFAVGRLLPFFESEAPQHAPALRARLAELAAGLDAARRASFDTQMRTMRLSPENPTDPLRGLLETVGRTSDPELRDQARLQAVEAAAKRRLWERARRLAEEIEGQETRRAARSLIDAFMVASVREAFEGDDEDFEKAAALARDADVTPALRAYGLAQAAEMAAGRGKRERALALLEEALAQASQAEAGTYARDGAAMLTATVAARLNSPRAWEALTAAVAALNEDEQFTGGASWFNTEARTDLGRGGAEALDEALQQFDVGGMFDAAARKNFDRAVAEARNLKSGAARSRALVAAARAELSKRVRARRPAGRAELLRRGAK